MSNSNISLTTFPWKNGYYQSREMKGLLFLVNGDELLIHPTSGIPANLLDDPTAKGSWKYGNFGVAHPDVVKATDKTHCNVKMVAWDGILDIELNLNDEGTQLTFYGLTNCVDVLRWVSEEELEAIKESGDPVDAMPHQYKMNPGKEGKLVWISGAPGLGKSTCAMLLAKNAGYVYYEGDAFDFHKNPYVSTEVEEPTLAMISQKVLKDVPQYRIDGVAEGVHQIINYSQGKDYDFDKLCNFYTLLCQNIESEQERIGGNFAIAQAVGTRKVRNHVRNQLGPNLIFVILHMTKDEQKDRIRARHGDAESFGESLEKCYDLYEPAGEDEPNTRHCLITEDMSREDVTEKILQLVEGF